VTWKGCLGFLTTWMGKEGRGHTWWDREEKSLESRNSKGAGEASERCVCGSKKDLKTFPREPGAVNNEFGRTVLSTLFLRTTVR